MYFVSKRIEVAGMHSLDLNYDSPCSRPHGHNWIIEVFCAAEELNRNGMIIDFSHIKKVVSVLDHQNINDICPFNPTAENLAKWICDQIDFAYKVTVQESEGNLACYVDINHYALEESHHGYGL